MNDLALLQNSLIVGAILFALGLVGILTRRNLIVMFLSAELMLQGISVSLVAWSRHHGDFGRIRTHCRCPRKQIDNPIFGRRVLDVVRRSDYLNVMTFK